MTNQNAKQLNYHASMPEVDPDHLTFKVCSSNMYRSGLVDSLSFKKIMCKHWSD